MSFVREWRGKITIEDVTFTKDETHLVCINGNNDPGCGRRRPNTSKAWLGAILPIQGTFKDTYPHWTRVYDHVNKKYRSFDWYTVSITSLKDTEDAVHFFLRDHSQDERHEFIKSIEAMRNASSSQ